jgi:ectoine hydroxylase-related dioxygenase (phytanoyl-CoA dioxygenase family)
MQATPQHLRQYEEEGYTLIKGLIPRDTVATVRTAMANILSGNHSLKPGHFQLIDPANYKRPDGSPIPAGIQRPARGDATFALMCDHPNLQNAMSALLGGDVQLFTEQALIKHGFINNEQGGRTFYHQDSYYWKINPALGCNCWIPFDNVGKDAIALSIMPRSQKGWTITPHDHYYDDPVYTDSQGKPYQRWRIPLDQIDYSKEVLVPMEPGDALFFSNYTWHRSEPNRTGKDLMAYAIAYQLTPAAAEKKLATSKVG